ncbi:tail fiber assembly protein [Yersinia enterocolitica]|uniref:tail fiber assembly protein n=1 Tax=Yersinia enterocolitica TaxID=630 RepID=UPI001C60CC43|nr:tail fiber assembly protein [Yersinia enterocolitica]EKN5956872.1 tail fiber assembly protein [Yersinia enterocolitica]MBW5823254.1 tail fiber assembly protein [Yersinia enterocolitica]MBW5879168.1 tail fiber assembly protein [Yersinia enterocolitica]MBX9477267.1 tail fiber assembly protein [Yersinia enterocolitica]
MTFKMSDKAQIVTVFNYHYETKEFTGATDAYIAPHTGIPGSSTLIAPLPIKAGYAVVFNEDAQQWKYTEDYRGTEAYDTQTGYSRPVITLGPLPEGFTSLAPTSQFDCWDGSQWVKDENAEKKHHLAEAEQEKRHLLNEANTKIQILQDSIELGLGTESTEAKLLAWRRYRVLLDRLDISTAPNIMWLAKPE